MDRERDDRRDDRRDRDDRGSRDSRDRDDDRARSDDRGRDSRDRERDDTRHDGRDSGRGSDSRDGNSARDDDRPRLSDRNAGGFKYRERTAQDIDDRASQQGGMYDSFLDTKYPYFKARNGDNEVRILPPTFDLEKWGRHYGIDIWVHQNVGPDHNTYLCLKKMKGEACEICDLRADLERDGADEDSNQIKPTKKVLLWIIDRYDEQAGPKLWPQSWTQDKELGNLSKDKRTGEILLVDHPDKGYDITFTREGQGLRTKYVGWAVARRDSPIHDDTRIQDGWTDFIQAHPLPDVLNYYNNEYLRAAIRGSREKKDKDLDRGNRESLRDRDRDDNKDRGRTRADEDRRPRARDELDDEIPSDTRGRSRERGDQVEGRGQGPSEERERGTRDGRDTRDTRRDNEDRERESGRAASSSPDAGRRPDDRERPAERERGREDDRGRDDARPDRASEGRDRDSRRGEERDVPKEADKKEEVAPNSVAARTRERLNSLRDERR